MILMFDIENWMSYKEPASFSMVASREKQHKKRLSRLNKYKTNILPVAVMYGGNASGKTNFFKALSFVKSLVVKGTHINGKVNVTPFKLDEVSSKLPVGFRLVILVEELVYEFSFSVTKDAILEEKLVKVTSTSEKTLYHRKSKSIIFDKLLKKNEYLKYVHKGTRDNQLFLTNSVSQKVDIFKPIYDWFDKTLTLITPYTRFGSIEHLIDVTSPLVCKVNKMLASLDTGISEIGGEKINLDNAPFDEDLKDDLHENIKEGSGAGVNLHNGDRFIIKREKGELIAEKLITYHPSQKGNNIKFEMNQESDGSRRIMDLLPAFLEASLDTSRRIYVVDEIDRSLHYLMTKELINFYLQKVHSGNRSQMLITTHDLLLMDQNIFRRDEMWVSERDNSGKTKIMCLSDYKDIRYDKDIRRSYLNGRFGGIPKLNIDAE